MGTSSIGAIVVTTDELVKASSTDPTAGMLEDKVDDDTISVVSEELVRADLTGGVTTAGNAATVVTNANLTGVVTSTGNATAIADEALALSKLARGTSGDILTANGAGSSPTYQTPSAGGGIVQNIQSFTSSGTWTKPAAVSQVYVRVWGGGGGGGGGKNGSSSGGGGGGGYTESLVSVTGNVTVTVGAAGTGGAYNTTGGAGGTSSFAGASTLQATGGGGGVAAGGAGGAAGVGSVGTISLTGAAGGQGSTYAGSDGGGGGGSPMGGGGADGGSLDAIGAPGCIPGGGGSAAGEYIATLRIGGVGGKGLVIVMY